MTPRLNVIAVGGAHQYPHFLPASFALHRRGTMAVTIYANDAAAAASVRALAGRLRMDCPPIVEMRLPPGIEQLAGRFAARPFKVPRLLYWASRLRRCEALLSAERTSTVLCHLPGRMPMFLHIPHGAGDRDAGFERRLRHFDHIVVAGAKDRSRMIAEGLVAPAACHIGGSVKLGAMARIADRIRPFAGERPCVLYNPHFSPELSSFEAVTERLIEAVVRDGRYDLVVAPHVRLAESWSAAKRRAWEARSVPGRIIVDMGSERSSDMTYTMAADVYLGDASSQVYEFIVRPRPCLFVNAHGVDWEDDKNFAMWRLGLTIGPNEDLLQAIDRARAAHSDFATLQQQTARAVFDVGDPEAGEADPIERVADLITDIVAGGS